eukprot:scaffold62844_cov17-Prasinocladus_malaysianus.AAC.1
MPRMLRVLIRAAGADGDTSFAAITMMPLKQVTAWPRGKRLAIVVVFFPPCMQAQWQRKHRSLDCSGRCLDWLRVCHAVGDCGALSEQAGGGIVLLLWGAGRLYGAAEVHSDPGRHHGGERPPNQILKQPLASLQGQRICLYLQALSID